MQERMPVVLFVDDEKHVVESLRDAMRRMPFMVLTATSGEGALKILQATQVDVVVTDERMPGMSGAELLAKVRQAFPDTVRIVLTGHATLASAIKAINEGEVYRFLSKPCRAVDLAQTIQEGARVKRLEKGSRELLRRTRLEQESVTEEESLPGTVGFVHRTEDDAIVIQDTDQSLEELIQEIESHLEAH